MYYLIVAAESRRRVPLGGPGKEAPDDGVRRLIVRDDDPAAAMDIRVELCAAQDGRTASPQTVYLHGRRIEVAETIDQWHGADYRYVKVSDRGGNLYILRHDEVSAVWELTMFTSARAQTLGPDRSKSRPPVP